MSIFEDLVEELKEENLLEETVIVKRDEDGENDEENAANEPEILSEDLGAIEEPELFEDSQQDSKPEDEELVEDSIDQAEQVEELSENSDEEDKENKRDTLIDRIKKITPEEEVVSDADSDVVDEDEEVAGLFEKSAAESDLSDEGDQKGWDVAPDEIDDILPSIVDDSHEIDVETNVEEGIEDHSDEENHETDLAGDSVEDEIEEARMQAEIDSQTEADEELDSKTDSEPAAETEADAEKAEELSEKDLFSQTLVEEVSGLQVVEHVFSGIEREQMRTPPKSHDVVPAKQALHAFIEKFKELDGIEQTDAETNLRNEIERWHSALLKRDQKISTAHLRRYSEDNSLNSKSLVSLARFYRNSDFSELVRSKFDLVVTRLFSNETPGNKREIALERDELINSLNELYAEWSSIPVYSVNDEDSELVLAAFKFEDFIAEAKKTKNFDGLITSGFFKRIKAFKKKTGENFFAPLLIASAVECNVAIGNRYVELIAKEKKKTDAKQLGVKYGSTHDKFVSEAASKTLQLVELLKDRKSENKEVKTSNKSNKKASSFSGISTDDESGSGYGRMILGVLLVVGVLAAGYFIYNSFYGEVRELTVSERKVKLERSFLHEFIKSAKIKDNTFIGNVTPAWNDLSKGKKQEIVGKIYSVGKVKGYSKVELKGDGEKIVAVTLGTKVEIAE